MGYFNGAYTSQNPSTMNRTPATTIGAITFELFHGYIVPPCTKQSAEHSQHENATYPINSNEQEGAGSREKK